MNKTDMEHIATVINSMPITPDCEEEKFTVGQAVLVSKNLPGTMRSHDCDFVGIVKQSNLSREYILIKLDSNGTPVDEVAWYPEEVLSPIEASIKGGKAIIKRWKRIDAGYKEWV